MTKLQYKKIFVLGAVFLIQLQSIILMASEPKVCYEGLDVILNDDESYLGKYSCALGSGQVELVLIDGQSAKRCAITTGRADSREKGRANYIFSTDDKVSGECNINSHNRFTEFIVDIKNERSETLLLELRLGVQFTPCRVQYWDGWGDPIKVKPGQKHLAKNNDSVEDPAPLYDYKVFEAYLTRDIGDFIKEIDDLQFSGAVSVFVFPGSGIFHGDNGLALGIHPDSFHSYFSSGIEPRNQDTSRFYTSVKMVVQPGDTERVRFVMMPFDSQEQYRGLLKGYYDAFPNVFSRDPNLPKDPFVFQLTEYLDAYRMGTLAQEYKRRRRPEVPSAAWLFTPFQRTGIYDPQQDDWDPNGAEAWPKWVNAPELDGITLQGFRQLLKNAITSFDPEVPVFAYVILQRCRWSLAAQKYPDAIFRRSDGTPLYLNYFCVLPGEGPIVTSFAYDNQFAQDLREDIERFWRRYGNNGFAFDNAWGTHMHFGQGPFPGAAFTHGKIYTAEALAYKTMIDFVRSLRADGRRPWIAANTPGHYATAKRVDTALVEAYYHPRWWRNIRHLMGNKPIVSSVETTVGIVQTLLNGIAPYAWQKKIHLSEEMWKQCCKDVAELQRIGWNPVRAAQVTESMQLERFGTCGGSSLVVGNLTENAKETELTIGEAGDNACVLFAIEGQQLLWTTADDGKMKTCLKVPGQWYTILKGIISITSESKVRLCDISWRDNKITASIELSKNGRGYLAIHMPYDKVLKSAAVNGKLIENVSDKLIKLPRKTTLALDVEDIIHVVPTESQLKAFSFLDTNRPGCNIIAARGKKDYKLCERLSDYFTFYDLWNRSLKPDGTPRHIPKSISKHPLKTCLTRGPHPKYTHVLYPYLQSPQTLLRIPITEKETKSQNKVVVGIIEKGSLWEKYLSSSARQALDEERPVIDLKDTGSGKLLIVSGKTGQQVRSALHRLFSILDEKYVLIERNSHKGW